MNTELKLEAEPVAANSPPLVWPTVLTLILLYLAAVYFDLHSGWFDRQVYLPFSSAESVAQYQPKPGDAALLDRGRTLYTSVCGVCHGDDGLGKANQFPPLAGSDWVSKDVENLVRVPQLGLTGSILVSGQSWNLSMPPVGANLSDQDLAGVLSYIRQSWGNNSSSVTADEVVAVRAAIAHNR